MPQNTPNRAYTYPVYGDAQDFPAQSLELATDIDLDVQDLDDQIQEALNRQSVAIRATTTQNIPVGAGYTALTWTSTDYDNAAMATLPTGVTIPREGVYLITAKVTFAGTGIGSPQYYVEARLRSTLGFMSVISQTSTETTGNVDAALQLTHLFYNDGTAGDVISVDVRHSHGAIRVVGARDLSVTRLSQIAL